MEGNVLQKFGEVAKHALELGDLAEEAMLGANKYEWNIDSLYRAGFSEENSCWHIRANVLASHANNE